MRHFSSIRQAVWRSFQKNSRGTSPPPPSQRARVEALPWRVGKDIPTYLHILQNAAKTSNQQHQSAYKQQKLGAIRWHELVWRRTAYRPHLWCSRSAPKGIGLISAGSQRGRNRYQTIAPPIWAREGVREDKTTHRIPVDRSEGNVVIHNVSM